MSKYTTEVRYICENKAGLTESAGFTNVDQVINGSWDKIFTTQCEFFNEDYRSVLCKKILKHYYIREICCETVGLWMLWMNERLETIMPYYNQLYESAQIEFNPMYNTDLTRQSSTNTEGSTSNETSVNQSTEGTDTTDHSDAYSDTPQGSLQNVTNMSYLTNARVIDESNYSESTLSSSTSSDSTVNSDETFLEKVTGKQGGTDYSTLLNRYRDTMLNIDMQVINEFNDLFFGLW